MVHNGKDKTCEKNNFYHKNQGNQKLKHKDVFYLQFSLGLPRPVRETEGGERGGGLQTGKYYTHIRDHDHQCNTLTYN